MVKMWTNEDRQKIYDNSGTNVIRGVSAIGSL